MSVSEGRTDRIWEALIKIGTALAWVCAGALISHEVRISGIENSRYTPRDALHFERATNERFEVLSERLAAMSGDVQVIRTILEADKERK